MNQFVSPFVSQALVNEHRIHRKVFFDDTDGGGVVYHANYLKYLDHARSEFLSVRGFELSVMQHKDDIMFAVAEAHVKYIKPARLSDQLIIIAKPLEASRVTLIFAQQIWRADGAQQPQELLLDATIKLACLSASRFKPVRIPDAVLESF